MYFCAQIIKLHPEMKKFLLTLICFFCIIVAQAQVTKTINVTTAGTLSSLLTTQEKSTLTNLTVTGNIDARDLTVLQSEIPLLSVMDLSNTNILAYSYYAANTIPRQIFNYNTHLTSVVFPSNLTTIEPEVFYGCKNLKYITFPNTLTSLQMGAFEMCTSLTSVIIPSSLIKIGIYSFGYCTNLSLLTLQNGVSYIDEGAFAGCSSLTSLNLPASLTSMNYNAFYGCTGVKTIYCKNSAPPSIQSTTFSNISATVYVPIGGIAAYKSASNWSSFPNVQEFILKVSTQQSTSITLSSASLNANLEIITDTPISSHGFCWNTTGSPTIVDTKVDNGAKTTIGAYSNTITGLTPGTSYYVKAFATDGERTVYGNELTFTTASLPSAAGTILGVTTVCQGQSSVTYIVPTIPSATSYVWTLPSGIVGTSTTNSITVKYERYFTAGSISVRGQNQWGDGASSTLNVTANLLPLIAGTISGNKTVCQGEGDVTYTVPAIDNATSYIWVLPTGATGFSTTNSITVNYSKSAVSGNITVKGHNDCGDGIVSYSMVTVNKLPIISLTNKIITSGGSVQLNPSISYSETGTLSYLWTPTTGLDNPTLSNPTATLTAPMTYTLTVTSSNGCAASAEMTVGLSKMSAPEIGVVGISNNKNIVVWNKPVSTGIDSYNIYKETNVSNLYSKIGAVPYDSLSVFVDNQSAPDVQSNKYKISILDKNGIESDQSSAHKTMHLTINKGTGYNWNLIWEAYEGFTVSTYNIYRGTSASDLVLIGSTSGSSTQYNDVNSPVGNVYYQLEVISPNYVSPSKVSAYASKNSAFINYAASRSNVATNAATGLSDNNMDNFEVYPNPSRGDVTISMEKVEDANYSITVSNTLGQKVYSSKLVSDKTKLDFTQFGKQGIYFVQVIDSKGVIVGRRKLVVE